MLGYVGGGDASAPVTRDVFDLQAEFFGDLTPELRKVSGLKHQDSVTGREGIDDGCFPGSGARSGINNHRAARLKDGAQIFKDFGAEAGEFRAAMVHDGTVHRP